MIEVRRAETPADIERCMRLRWTVFIEEQGVPPSFETDSRDRTDAVHALALLDGVPCGAGRFVIDKDGTARIGRMVVIDDVRRRGVGRAVLKFLETEARRRGATKFALSAQVRARGFYERAGYSAVGREYDDGTRIMHVAMDKPA